jgi:hypothetical protein
MKLFKTCLTALVFSSACLLSPVHAAVVSADATSDTFGVGAVQHDILQITTFVDGVNFAITIEFVDPIAAPSDFAANSVVGFIDLDTDQNSGTGATPFINIFAPPPPIALGNEFYVDIGSEPLHFGFVDVLDAITDLPVANVAITFLSNSLSQTIPLSSLGNDEGVINFGAVLGTFPEPTDRAPDGEVPLTTVVESPVPEPTSLALWSFTALGAAVASRRRRRSAAA